MIPISGDQVEEYTPESLANVVSPPAFKLRPWTTRDRNEYRRALRMNRLRQHSLADERDEAIRGLHANWSPAEAKKYEKLFIRVWDEADQATEAIKGSEDPEEREKIFFGIVDRAAAAQVTAIERQLIRLHDPLVEMEADNEIFAIEAPKVALSMFLVGWKNLDVPYLREEGHVPLATIDAVQKVLIETEQAARADKVEGIGVDGYAFQQLLLVAVNHLNLNRGEAKNSVSPPSSASTQNGSKMAGQGKASGSSPAKTAKKRAIPKTQRGSSRPRTAR